MLVEAAKERHGVDYIATFDDDDIYSKTYLEMMLKYFRANPSFKLVNFRDFLCIQVIGEPVRYTKNASIEMLARSLEESRIFTETEEALDSAKVLNKWYLQTGGGVLPSGFGFSFVMHASVVRDGIRYSESHDHRSGEEDQVYYEIKARYGANSVLDLPLSRSVKLAAHIENGQNISGDKHLFRFPSPHYVGVPRPLSFISTELLSTLIRFHPQRSIRKWAEAVAKIHETSPKHGVLTRIPNLQQTAEFAEMWQNPLNWTDEVLSRKGKWFQSPAGLPVPGGQDIPLDAPEIPVPTPAQRSLVVVPGSHHEYAQIANELRERRERSVTDKSVKVPKGHGVKLADVYPAGSPKNRDYSAAARQLAIRSSCSGTSAMLIWNSALIHQGTLSFDNRHLITRDAFVPPLQVPPTFAAKDTANWREYLDKEGYVVVRDVLEDGLDSYLKALLADINSVNPSEKLQTLNDVRDQRHLGLQRRGLLYSLGFPHGEFAWKLRCDRQVRKLWGELFQTDALMGSADVPAISQSENVPCMATQWTHDNWLHWDQNALLEPVGTQEMYQSMVYLFPNSDSKFGGCDWARIAMVICMVPKYYGRSMKSEKVLLSLAITGEASNHWPQLGLDNYGWAGIRDRELRQRFPGETAEDVERSHPDLVLTANTLVQRGWCRMLPQMNANVRRDELAKVISEIASGVEIASMSEQEMRLHIGQTPSEVLAERLTLHQLRRLVHKRVEEYVGFVSEAAKSSASRKDSAG